MAERISRRSSSATATATLERVEKPLPTGVLTMAVDSSRSSASSTGFTVTCWALLQSLDEKVSDAGTALAAPASLLATATVTLPDGAETSRTA